MPDRSSVERHIPWPRDRHWRPGEPITLVEDGETITYRLRGVMRDTDPSSAFATVTLEAIRSLPLDGALPGDAELSNAG